MKLTQMTLRAVMFLAAAALTANGGNIVVSTFNTTAEGWRVGDFLVPTGSPALPDHLFVGGNPGGFIRTTDQFDFNAYLAPSAFLGNWTAMGVTSVGFDLRHASTDIVVQAYLSIVGPLGVSISRFGLPALRNNWSTFSFDTTSNIGWFHTNNGESPGFPVSALQFAFILSNVQALRIDADWHIGSDQVDLDNVYLANSTSNAVPEPRTGMLLAAAQKIHASRPDTRFLVAAYNAPQAAAVR